jgi:hypothetical protein
VGAVIDIACGKTLKLSDNLPLNSASVSFEYDEKSGSRGKHEFSCEPIKEFGGCLKFRPDEKKAFFEENRCVLALNSEYTAFRCALGAIQPARVHIPHYASSVWGKIAQELEIETVYYNIDSAFLPKDIDERDGDAVFLINYYGLCTEYIKNAPFKNKIVDNSMAFFEEPPKDENTYTIYSARKFLHFPTEHISLRASLLKICPSLKRTFRINARECFFMRLSLAREKLIKNPRPTSRNLQIRQKQCPLLQKNSYALWIMKKKNNCATAILIYYIAA